MCFRQIILHSDAVTASFGGFFPPPDQSFHLILAPVRLMVSKVPQILKVSCPLKLICY